MGQAPKGSGHPRASTFPTSSNTCLPSILYFTILYYTILYYTILYYTILYYTILYYTIHTILYYTILYYTITILDQHGSADWPLIRLLSCTKVPRCAWMFWVEGNLLRAPPRPLGPHLVDGAVDFLLGQASQLGLPGPGIWS